MKYGMNNKACINLNITCDNTTLNLVTTKLSGLQIGNNLAGKNMLNALSSDLVQHDLS
jgi:hypothetical protein